MIEQAMKNRENKVPWLYQGRYSRENKVTRIISVLQYLYATVMGDNIIYIGLKSQQNIYYKVEIHRITVNMTNERENNYIVHNPL